MRLLRLLSLNLRNLVRQTPNDSSVDARHVTGGSQPARAVAKLSLVTVGCFLVAASAASAASAGGPTAAALYRALRTTALQGSQLPDSRRPDGFNAANVDSTTLSKNAKKHHAVGEVEFDVYNDVELTRANAFIIYAVFPGHADALGDYRDTQVTGKTTGRLAAPRSLPRPAQIVNGSVTGTNVQGKTSTQGVTGLEYVDGNVVVAVITMSTSDSKRGNVPDAISLARFALEHLRSLGGQ